MTAPLPPEPPPAPQPREFEPSQDWEHYALYRDVKEAVQALPAHFTSETFISGISAPDLYTLNAVLGAAIEDQVVHTLNAIRHVWDPDDHYSLYRFVRQPQTFPDVLLKTATGEILLGIELKGWYILAKEKEPSFRYSVTPDACATADLMVVVPWVLAQVISGKPVVFEPFVAPAKYVALYRNYHWQHVRRTSLDTTIRSPADVRPYPVKTDHIVDIPVADRDNFGRIARTGVMDAYLAEIQTRMLAGIRVEHWVRFLKAFQERRSDEQIRKELDRLRRQVKGAAPERADPVLGILQNLEALLE